MNMRNRMILVLLAVSLLLSGCGAASSAETIAQTEAPTEAAAPTEPAETQPAEVSKVAETVFPTDDSATGTLKFYFGDKEIYAGGQVSDIIDLGVHSLSDLSQTVLPGHMSGQIRVRIEDENVKESERPYIFFVAFNPSDEPLSLPECLIYSITVNMESGIRFGSGNETEAFVTYETTADEIVAAYGEPDFQQSNSRLYEEMAYYEPFSCAYFSFKSNVVRQIVTYYSANVYGDLAEDFEHELDFGYFGADCYILMDQYLDVEPYLPQEEETDSTAATESTETAEVQESTLGILEEDLDEFIMLGDQKIEMGVRCVDMPEPFGSVFDELLVPLSRNYYLRTGRINAEEFYLININGQKDNYANELLVKGVITENCNYVNWGVDYSAYNTFDYEGLTPDSTIDDIVAKFGQPKELHCSSNGKVCYAWMWYEDTNGNTLQVRVDPITNQLVELRMAKHYENEKMYQ